MWDRYVSSEKNKRLFPALGELICHVPVPILNNVQYHGVEGSTPAHTTGGSAIPRKVRSKELINERNSRNENLRGDDDVPCKNCVWFFVCPSCGDRICTEEELVNPQERCDKYLSIENED